MAAAVAIPPAPAENMFIVYDLVTKKMLRHVVLDYLLQETETVFHDWRREGLLRVSLPTYNGWVAANAVTNITTVEQNYVAAHAV